MKKALILGATGFVGSYLVRELLDDPDYGQVTMITRKKPDFDHPKLVVVEADLHSLSQIKDQITGDALFITFGTTKKFDPDYYIDYHYPLLLARLARENGVKSLFIVTAAAADIHSRFLYNKRKGEIERDIAALGFEHAHFFRPSFLTGGRKESRPTEKMMIGIWAIVNPFLFTKGLQRHKSIPAKTVARAMRLAAKEGGGRIGVWFWKEMQDLVKRETAG